VWKAVNKKNKNEYYFKSITYYNLHKDAYGELCDYNGNNIHYPEILYKFVDINLYTFYWNGFEIPMPFDHFVTSYLIYKY
jgi:hypothetical protein